MVSFMLATGILSMIISNTAATAMMLPIVEAVVVTIDEAERRNEVEAAVFYYDIWIVAVTKKILNFSIHTITIGN